MAPETHALLGWWSANVIALTRRDRLLMFLAGVLPDLDGLGLLYSREAYVTYHHILAHNLAACAVWLALTAPFARQRLPYVALGFLSWHLHLAADYFGSGGPPGSPPWPLAYLYPWQGQILDGAFAGPAWYSNPWQWPLNAWPNLAVTLLGLVGLVYIAVRLDRTPLEFVWTAWDHRLCGFLRRYTGGQHQPEWGPTESIWIRRTFVFGAELVFLACVVAASQAG